jgi:predicted acylesterase/phospholipase RssA
MLGLVLTAGGARGAYQAGVLKRLGEMPGLRDGPSPFAIVAGASAGAINGSLVAAGSARFGPATREIASLWSELRFEQVLRTDGPALARTALGLARDLVLGGLLGRTVTSSLFDASPLEALLASTFPPRAIGQAIRSGRLYADAQSADLMSYLLFDQAYTRALVDIGYRDAGGRIDAVEALLAAAGRLGRARLVAVPGRRAPPPRRAAAAPASPPA